MFNECWEAQRFFICVLQQSCSVTYLNCAYNALWVNAARNSAKAAILSVRVRRGGGSGVIWESENKQTNKQRKQEHLGIWAFFALYENTSRIICTREMCCCCGCLLFFKDALSQVSSRQKCIKAENVDREGMDFNWCDPVSRSPTGSPPKKNKTKQTNTQRLTVRQALCNCETVQTDMM